MNGRAVLSDGQGGVHVGDIEVGEPGDGEVLVALHASGVCHTDYDIAKVPFPMVLGHEGAGEVAAVGDGVPHVAVGDRVLLTWAIACGRCFQCSRGNQVLCEALGLTPRGHADYSRTTHNAQPVPRAFNLGTMSTHTIVRGEAVVKLTTDMPPTSACILGCGVMTGFGSVVNVAQVEPGSNVVVLGAGGVGLNAIQGARISSAGAVIAVDINEERLERARRFGATDVVLASTDDTDLLEAAEQIKARTGGRGADYAFECTAVPHLAGAFLRLVRQGGTAVAVSGVEQKVEVDLQLFEFDKTYINPLYGKCRPQIDFPRLFHLYETKQLLVDELVTATYPLDDIDRAFEDLVAGRNAKGVLEIR
jgi:S-(hydroxymethyl)glutathione dehydrogenase/alcohol dehydrogenase